MSQHDRDIGDLIAERERERRNDKYRDEYEGGWLVEEEDHEPPPYVDPLRSTPGMPQDEEPTSDRRLFGWVEEGRFEEAGWAS